MKKIGQFLKERRTLKGYSYRELGKLADVSHQHIKDIEDGKKEPTFSLLMKVINALMVDAGEFLKGDGIS